MTQLQAIATEITLAGSRRLPRYSDSEPSTIRFVDRIPSHWRTEKLKHVASVRFSSVDKKTEEGETPVRLCNYTDVYNNDRIVDDPNFMAATASPDEIARFTLMKGDVLITKDSEAWNDIAVPAYVSADMPGVLCGYHLAHIRPNTEKLDGAFLSRAFSAEGIREQFHIAANGITRYGLPNRAIAGAFFPIPPLDEQCAIAAFLERETIKIDELIKKKTRLISLLNDKREARITAAVTAKIGDSKSVPIKRFLTFTTSGSRGWAEFYSDEGDLFIQSGNLNRRLGLDLSVVQKILPPDGAEAIRTMIQRDDILICITGAYTGNVAVVDFDPPRAFINQHIALLRVDGRRAVPRFLAYLLASSFGQGHFKASQYGGTKQGLGFDDILSVVVSLPPLIEQERIVQELDSEIALIEQTSSKIEECIRKLRQYRSAIVSAAVTGQIDVRNYRPEAPCQ